jgi:hypothetical protein
MQDLSLHILDIVENSIEAEATLVEISITEDIQKNKLVLEIKDNGSGISAEQPSKALNPFYSTKRSSNIGLGLSLLKQATEQTGGYLQLQTDRISGTTITAIFVRNHIDRKPLGNIEDTVIALIYSGGEKIDYIYRHRIGDQIFELDTREIKKKLDGITITHPRIINFLKNNIIDNLVKMKIER